MSDEDATYRILNSHTEIYKLTTFDKMFGYSKYFTQAHNNIQILSSNITVITVYAMNCTREIYYFPDENKFGDEIRKRNISKGNDGGIVDNFYNYVYCYTEKCDFIGFKGNSWGSFYTYQSFKVLSKEDVRKNIDSDMEAIRSEIREKYNSKLRNERELKENIRNLEDDVGYYYDEYQFRNNVYYRSYFIQANILTVLVYDMMGGILQMLKLKYSIPVNGILNRNDYDSSISTYQDVYGCQTPVLITYNFIYVLYSPLEKLKQIVV